MSEPYDISGLEHTPAATRGGVLTIGNFDGVHLGHRKLLRKARALADAGDGPVVAMTFEPPPDRLVRPHDAPLRISTARCKSRLLHQAGADFVVTAQTDHALLNLSPSEFVAQVIVGVFAARHIVEGPNFFFGHRRAGSVDTLRQAGETYGFAVHVCEVATVELDGAPATVSSTLVRQCIAEGRMELVETMLARPYAMTGTVVGGRGIGSRVLQYPTANLDPADMAVPADGVYAGEADINGCTHAAAVSIGTNPTLGPTPRTIEANLLDTTDNCYGKTMTLRLFRRMRDQQTFDSAEALREQIARDVRHTREIHAQRH
jgi:riboflavin kinase/FMN adenylyltransferase